MNDILTETESGVTTLTFNRADKKNSITAAMYATLASALETARDDKVVRAVVIRGAAAVFSAGNDIEDFLNAPPVEEGAPVQRFLENLAQFPKPVVAAVCGPAVGIGTTMLFHCDLVYAGSNAFFLMPFVDLGLCPEAASSLLATQMFGHHRAAEALLLGEGLTAEAALAAGLVNKVAAPEEIDDLAMQKARKLAAKPLTALVETKALMKGGLKAAVMMRMDEERSHFQRLLEEPAAREAFSAFLEKRKPDFSRL